MTLPASIGANYVFGRSPSGTVYAAGSDLSRSTDNGAHWETIPIGSSLLTWMAWSGGVMYMAGFKGVTRSDDGRTTWSAYSGGLTWSPYALTVDPDGRLIAGTVDGKRYRTSNASSVEDGHPATSPNVEATADATVAIAPNPIAADATVTVRPAKRGSITLTLHDAIGRSVVVLADQEVEAGTRAFDLDARGLASGAYFFGLAYAGQLVARAVQVVRSDGRAR